MLSPRDQIAAIGAEIMRARVWEDEHDKEKTATALERALELTDLTINDARSRDRRRMLLGLRNELAEAYSGTYKDFMFLYNAL